MILKNLFSAMVRTMSAGLITLTAASIAQADGLPYGGNVSAYVVCGQLVVIGDNDNNLIHVTDASEFGGTPGDVVVWGGGSFAALGIPQAPEGEYSRVNGGTEPVFFSGFHGNVYINTRDGADTLTFDLVECQNAAVEFGDTPAGAIATLSSNSLNVHGNLWVDHDGDGKVFTTIASSAIHGNVSIDGGSQNDPSPTFLSGAYLTQLTVGGNLNLDGGGEDVLIELSTISGNVSVETGSESSSVTLDQLTISGKVSVDLGAGDDSVTVSNSTIAKKLSLDGGSGTDSSVVSATTYRKLTTQNIETHTP